MVNIIECMFIRAGGVTYVEIPCNHLKRHIFINSRKMIKSVITLFRKYFLLKINKNKKIGVNST